MLLCSHLWKGSNNRTSLEWQMWWVMRWSTVRCLSQCLAQGKHSLSTGTFLTIITIIVIIIIIIILSNAATLTALQLRHYVWMGHGSIWMSTSKTLKLDCPLSPPKSRILPILQLVPTQLPLLPLSLPESHKSGSSWRSTNLHMICGFYPPLHTSSAIPLFAATLQPPRPSPFPEAFNQFLPWGFCTRWSFCMQNYSGFLFNI